MYIFENKWDFNNIVFFFFLLILPNLLGMINLPIMGFHIHFFQLAIFFAAFKFGPIGGLVSGFVGSFFSIFLTSNPYIMGGNMILGFFTGLFLRYKFSLIKSVWLAFLIQLPFLFVTDFFFMNMPLQVIGYISVSLFMTNTFWAWFVKNVA